MRPVLRFAGVLVLMGGAAVPSSSQNQAAPPLRYEMDVSTTSGLGAGMAGGMRGALGMMMGGASAPQVQHALSLTIGSPQAVPAPQAEHFFQPAARLGKSVPLAGGRGGEATSEPMLGGERPKGRVLLFWGCGAKAGPGQPIVVDFAKVAAGQMPSGLTSSAPPARGITGANSRSIAVWPNDRSNKRPTPDSSLLGPHRIASNLGPEIAFTLAQDYMGALNAQATAQPDGSMMLRWNALAPATGYVAWAVGGMDGAGRGGDVVWWSSGATSDFGAAQSGWLSPATVAGYIGRRLVMPPSQTSCQIPAEVKRAAGEMMMTSLNAFGPEANFSYPPRPPAPAPWRLEWSAKVRFKSQTMLIPGMDMGAMGAGGGASRAGADDDDHGPAPGGEDRDRKKKGCRGPFGVRIPGC